jgi:hypothetical protein
MDHRESALFVWTPLFWMLASAHNAHCSSVIGPTARLLLPAGDTLGQGIEIDYVASIAGREIHKQLAIVVHAKAWGVIGPERTTAAFGRFPIGK